MGIRPEREAIVDPASSLAITITCQGAEVVWAISWVIAECAARACHYRFGVVTCISFAMPFEICILERVTHISGYCLDYHTPVLEHEKYKDS